MLNTPETCPADRARAIDTISLGFIADPVARWVWPDLKDFMFAMPRFTAAFSGRAFDLGTADETPCGRAAACWLPPGEHADEDEIGAVIETTAAPELAGELDDFFGQMDGFHPTEPCWYLPQIAADPAYQGRGLGSALLKRRLRLADEQGMPAYLESSNVKNVPLYERHGFSVIGRIQAGSSPIMYPMLRLPRV